MLKSKIKKGNHQKPWFLINKKAMTAKILIKLLILIILFAMIGGAIYHLLKVQGVI